MPLPFAPTIDLVPTGAGSFSVPSPILPSTRAPLVPRVPPASLGAARGLGGVATAARAAGTLTRVAGTAGLVIQAAGLGLNIGNTIYEDVLDRPFGPSLGDYLNPGAPRPAPLNESLPVQPGGTPGVTYRITGAVTADRYSTPNYRNYGVNILRTGPIGVLTLEGNRNNVLLNEDGVLIANLGNSFTGINNVRWLVGPDIARADGLPEEGPQPGPLTSNPLPQPSTPPQPFPQTLPQPAPGPLPQIAPQPLPEPLPLLDPLTATVEDALPELPELLRLLGPVDGLSPFPLPLPEPEPESYRPPVGTASPQCCPTLERSNNRLEEAVDDIRNYFDNDEPVDLSGIEAQLEGILSRLQGQGTGTLDLTPCDAEETMEATYTGEGLQGLYEAVDAITQSLNTIHTDTKCPPDVNAVLPMHWDAKHGEIPQLVVSWRKVGGGDSKWAMNIPHPRADIGPDYPFNFPDYQKGGNMASVRLIDNSQLIVNALSEAEAQKVIDYIGANLLDPAYIPQSGLRMVYSKNVADYAEVEVTAVHIKKFQGHKTTAPSWALRIPS
ncbi:MAG: hypothetical protein AAGB19_00430 [Cyanobacteria bacterium P01_F01_bin.3]